MKRAVLLALFALLGAGAAKAQSADARRISVLGRATVEAPPDYATINIGVLTKGTTAAAALDGNSAAIQEVLAFSRRFGIEARDVQTSSVRLQEVGDYVAPGRKPPTDDESYQASNTIKVRVRNLARFGEYVRTTVENGANRISSVEFDIADAQKIADEARAAAVQDAARKARLLAEAAGVKLGPLLQLHYPPRVETRSTSGEADMPRRTGPAPMNVPVEIGTVEIVADVDVTWLIEQP